MNQKIYKQTIKLATGEITTYFQENPNGSLVFYTPEAPFIVEWLAAGNTPEEWNSNGDF